MADRFLNYIGGKWIPARGGRTFPNINPATGESRVVQFAQSGGQNVSGMLEGAGIDPVTGLPLTPGTEPMNPAKTSAQAQNLSLPGRFVLPALLANSSEQERIAAELNEQEQTGSGTQPPARQTRPVQNATEHFTVIPSPDGFVGLAVRLLESHIITRNAMKAPPKTSTLNGNVSTANESAAINETLNEMQRTKGGDTVQDDESLYQVSLRRPNSTGAADWTGEVIGPPALFPLKTVNVIVAGKTLIVFDQTNKKLWDATLTYNIAGGNRAANGEPPPFGEGPCVERGDTLYVIDQAVLTAFDIATGNARWRLPSVGVVGLFFDDKGMLYVNTTTADPESIKYSRQIDISQKIDAILLKIDPQTGRTLWSVKPGGFISYFSGKFIYTVQAFDPGDQSGSPLGIELPAYLKIRRINPADGRVLWVTTDDASAERGRFGAASSVYNVIDARQSYLQDVVVAGLRGLGYNEQADRSVHFSYEMVALSPRCCVELGIPLSEEDRKRPYIEVSGRKGLGVKADDLMDTLIAKALEEVDSRHAESPAAGRRRAKGSSTSRRWSPMRCKATRSCGARFSGRWSR